jgi:hypothetical protein
VFERQIQQESGFDPTISSPAGAQGIAQIMPATAKSWGVDPLKPRQALDAAARHMAEYVKQFGSYEDALRAYNAGPGAVDASKNYAETNNYVRTILGGASPNPGAVHPNRPVNGAPGAVRVGGQPGSGVTLADLQGALQAAQTPSLPVGTLPALPSFAASPVMAGQSVQTSGMPTQARQSIDSLLQIASKIQGAVPAAQVGGAQRSTGPVLYVGDSLGVGTAPYLKQRIGQPVDAFTKVGRQSQAGIDILKQQIGNRDYGRIVLDLGTNDPSATELARSIREAKRLAPNATIYVPTVNGPNATEKNAVIRRLAGGRVQVVDWRNQSGPDGIHQTAQGYQARAHAIAQVLRGTDQGSPATVAAGTRGLRPFGGWDGTEGPASTLESIGRKLGLTPTSTKRNNTNPYSGSRSDHDFGNKDAYAVDMSNGSAPTPQMDEYAFRLMHALGFTGYKRGQPINTSQGVTTRNGLRYQVIYRGNGEAYGGNHLNHVHLGIKRVG